MSEHPVSKLDAWLRKHHGVVSRAALFEMDISRSASRRLVTSQRLVTVMPGIYLSPAYSFGRPQILTALCLRNPELTIAFTTAGQELRFRGMTDRRIHALLPHGSSPGFDDVVVHRCRQIDPVDIAGRRQDGVQLTSPPRTLFDAASIIGIDGTESAIEQAIAERRCTIGTLMATSRRLHHPRRPGALVFETVIGSRPLWRAAARSELERLMRVAIEHQGLPQPVVNMKMVLLDGTPIEIDLAWPEWKVALEVDHPFWHDGAREARRDKRRDRKLGAMGWLPQRITKADIDEDLPQTVREVEAVLVQRGWKGATAAA